MTIAYPLLQEFVAAMLRDHPAPTADPVLRMIDQRSRLTSLFALLDDLDDPKIRDRDPKIKDLVDKCGEAIFALEVEIAATEATSLEGVIAQVRLLADTSWSERQLLTTIGHSLHRLAKHIDGG
jgi:hypothetical protein